MRRYKLEGMKELIYSVNQLGELPQSCVNYAAKSGANLALKAARANAPVEYGDLRDGIILKGERTKIQGKKVYDVMMDPSKNDIFQKQTKTGKRRKVTKGKVSMVSGNYYYPASQEFGFVTKNGGYVPGYHFLRESLTENVGAISDKVITVLSKRIDKVLAKG